MLVVVFAAMQASTGHAQTTYPLADKIPADAVVYLGWAGADSLQGAYSTSNLANFIDHSNLRSVAADLIPKLFGQLAGHTWNEQATHAFDGALPVLWKHPCAFYISNVRIKDDGTPAGDAALMCDPGSDSAQLLKQFQALKDSGYVTAVVTQGSLIGIATPNLATPPATSVMASSQAFLAAMKPLQANPAMAVYIDGRSLMIHADESAARDVDAAKVWPDIKEKLGLNGFLGFAMSAGFDHGNWATASVVQAPAPRTGLLAVIEPKPIDPLLLARIPATAMSVSVTNFDTALLYDTIASAMAVTPKGDKTFHQAVGVATMGLGRNLRKQILASLGPQWVVYSDAATHGLVVLNHPVNADDASDGLVSAAFGLINLANSQIPGANKNPVVTADQKTVKGIDLTSAVTKWVSPTFAVKGKVLYLGLGVDPVVTAATLLDIKPGKDVLHSAAFTAAAALLGSPAYASFDYADLPQSTPAALDSLNASSKQVHQILGSLGVDYPELNIPKAADLKGHLSPALSVNWADASGIYSKSISPFPGSAMLLGDPQKSLVGIGAVSAVTSIAVPALAKAREAARRTQSMSNERQICLAVMMYATDHKGTLPPDLGSCLQYVGGSLRIFLDPDADSTIPPEVQNGNADAKAAWINDHADYVLLIPNQKLSHLKNASTVAEVAPRDAEQSTKPVAIGFADGHVEACPPDRVHDLLHPDGGM
jgi:hypothetical protein